MGAVVDNEALERRRNFLSEVGVFRVVGADVAVHFLRGEGNVEIVGDESGFFIGKMEIRFAKVGENMFDAHPRAAYRHHASPPVTPPKQRCIYTAIIARKECTE